MTSLPYRLIARLAFVLLLVAGGLGLMLLIYRIRIEELGQNLEDGADKTLSLRSLGLISKFQMMQERIRKGESIALLRKEARNTYAGSDSVLATRRDKLPWVYEMGLGIVNFVNFVAGGKTVTNRSKTRSEALMEEAYMLELQRNFDGAVKTYDKLAADPGSKGIVNFLRLHRAYCLAFSSSRRRAIEDLNFVVATNPVGEYRLTAEVLLAYLSDFDRKAEAIQALPQSALKGAAYFNVGSYTDAINTLESLPGKQRNAEATYVLGRSYEEIGKSGKALENYRHLIRTKPGSRHALLANRRIFALGSIYASGQKLVDEAATVARTAIPDAELLREKKSTENLARAVAKKNTEIAAEIQVEKIAVAPVIPEEQPALAENITRATTALPAPETSKQVRKLSPRFLKSKPKLSPADDPRLTRTDRKNLIEREARIDELALSDGNKLWGIILEDKEKTISMLTVMGKVTVDKEHIIGREKVTPAGAFRVR